MNNLNSSFNQKNDHHPKFTYGVAVAPTSSVSDHGSTSNLNKPIHNNFQEYHNNQHSIQNLITNNEKIQDRETFNPNKQNYIAQWMLPNSQINDNNKINSKDSLHFQQFVANKNKHKFIKSASLSYEDEFLNASMTMPMPLQRNIDRDEAATRKKFKTLSPLSPKSTSSSPLSSSSSSTSSIASTNNSLKSLKNFTKQEAKEEIFFDEDLIKIKINSDYSIKFNNKLNLCGDVNKKKQISSDFNIKSNNINSFLYNIIDYIKITSPFDICLLVNKKKLNAHKILLINSSKYFRDSLSQNNNIDSLQLNPQIENFKCLEICIEFIYSGGSKFNLNYLDTDIELIENLKKTAKILELDDVIAICDTIINSNVINQVLNEKKKLEKLLNEEKMKELIQTQSQNINNHNNNPAFDFNTNVFNQLLMNPNFFTKNIAFCSLMNNFLQNQHVNMFNYCKNDQYTPTSNKVKNESGSANKDSHYENTKQPETCHNSKANEKLNNTFENDTDDSLKNKVDNKKTDNENEDVQKLKKFLKSKLDQIQKISDEGHALFKDCDVNSSSHIVQDYMKELLSLVNSYVKTKKSKETFLNLDIEIDTFNRDLIIKNKYIYPNAFFKLNHEDEEFNKKCLNEYFENHSFVDINLNTDCSQHFDRHSLIIFSVTVGENSHFKLNNFLIKTKLNFTDLDVLRESIKYSIDTFLNKHLLEKFKNKTSTENNYQLLLAFESIINKVFFLKKPSNCKTIKLDEIKTSKDCYRAIVEYSVISENQTPHVLVTCNATVFIKSINNIAGD